MGGGGVAQADTKNIDKTTRDFTSKARVIKNP
jgi:hypothetical protein